MFGGPHAPSSGLPRFATISCAIVATRSATARPPGMAFVRRAPFAAPVAASAGLVPSAAATAAGTVMLRIVFPPHCNSG